MSNKSRLLDEFFQKYSAIVIRNAYYYLKDYYAAEDICQETFIRLAENIDKVPPENVKAWLLCVSEHLAYDYMKKGGKYSTNVGLDEKMLEITATDDYLDPSYVVECKEELAETESILKRLKREKPKWFELVQMCYLEKLDNTTMGERLGINAALVSKWKERIKKWLKKAYKNDERGSDN